MIRFEDRFLEKSVISIKLVLVEFKFFAIADKGYIIDFEALKPSLNEN